MKGVEIRLIKDSKGLFHPYNELDYETALKIPVGEDNVFRLQRVRNPAFHRKYFALIKLAFENQEVYQDIGVFRKVMQMRAGYYDVVETEKKSKLYIPKSISYAELDQTEFEELYNKVYAEISKLLDLVKEEDQEYFQNELARFA